MGQDVQIFFGHHWNQADFGHLPQRLDQWQSRIAPYVQQLGLHTIETKEWLHKNWGWGHDPAFDLPFDEWLVSESVYLLGPASFSLTLGHRAGWLGSWIRWRSFGVDQRTQTLIRLIGRELAFETGSPGVGYVPDSGSEPSVLVGNGIDAGLDFQQLLEQLDSRTAPSAGSAASIGVQKTVRSNRKTGGFRSHDDYFVDMTSLLWC